MIVIRCLSVIRREQFEKLYDTFVEMAKNGLILLPASCELLNEVPPDEEIVVIKKKGD